jgi:hypothetical protein
MYDPRLFMVWMSWVSTQKAKSDQGVGNLTCGVTSLVDGLTPSVQGNGLG